VARLSQEEGVPFDKIAPQVRDGVSVPTLRKHFMDELIPSKGGQKPFGPTADERRLVERLASKGFRYDEIALALRKGVSKSTLCRHFLQEMQRGRVIASLKVAETLYEKATVDRDTTALIWWTKTQMGWKAARDEPKDVPEPKSVEKIERVIVLASSNP